MSSIIERKLAMRRAWAERAKQCEWRGNLTMDEIMKHRKPDDCWNVIDGDVYDMTQYINGHPGGDQCFLQKVDISYAFKSFHRNLDISFIEKLKIGKLV
jgi:cytochrome b involved in lipid metabolism